VASFSDLKRLWEELKDELRATADEARKEWRRGKWEIDNPGQKAVREEEADEIIDWYRSLSRQALILRPDPRIAVLEAAAQIGGPAWLADGEEWPLDADGHRLEFVAQVDFRRLPKLEEFPECGVLRFFVGRDELFGANWEEPDRSGCRILWHPDAIQGGRLEPPAPLDRDDMSPFQSESRRAEGLALSATPAWDIPDYESLEVTTRLAGESDRLGMNEVDDEIFDISEEREQGHRIGGYPMFTQPDFRAPGHYDDYNVLLLGLTSDETIMWGDVGEAMFLMRQADLDARDFSRVIFYWDCH
jgi:uncharacterized protein YwqG